MKIVFLIVSQIFWIMSYCQTGSIHGLVTSRICGNYGILAYASVSLVNTKIGTTTDLDGRFKIDNIPEGVYEILVTHVQLDSIKEKIEIVKNSNLEINFEFICKFDKHKKDKICPLCLKSDKVIPWDNYKGRTVCCHPNWYCKRDKFGF